MSQGPIFQSPVAGSIPFDDSLGLYNSTIDNVEIALDNIRQQRVSQVAIIDSNTVSSTSLTFQSNTFNSVQGTGSGFIFNLPDATTCLTGQEFELANESSNQFTVKNYDGTTLATVNSQDLIRLVLEDTSTSAGNWLLVVTSTTATGIQSYSVGSSTTFNTSSTTDTIITGMSVTPVSGRYGLWYSSDITISNNNNTADIVIYQNGSAVERTRRITQGVSSNFRTSHQSIGEVTVNGSEQIDVRVKISSGSLTVSSRRLILIRLGS